MTSTPRPVADWLADFRTRHRIDLPLPDGSIAKDRAALAAAYAAENVPPRFAGALPTVPEVDEWAAAVVHQAIAESARRGRQVTTIHGGPSLLILGSTGVGKTHEVYGATRAISLLGIHSRWQVVSAVDLYARLQPRHGVDQEEEFRSIVDAPILVVDDLGAANESGFVERVNHRLVNHRYNLAMPTIFTSNLPARDIPADPKAVPPTPFQPGLATVLGDRVASRLREMTRQVAIKGEDRRRAA